MYRRPCFSSCGGRKSREAIIGVKVSATTADTAMATESVTANERKSRPTTPPIRSRGMKTASREAVMEMMVNPICRAPLSAARIGVSPCST